MMNKNEIYDYISRTLTDYESGEVWASEVYECLVFVQNHWSEIISE